MKRAAICADCRRDASGQAPLFFAMTAERYAFLCPGCATAYPTVGQVFRRLRGLLLSESGRIELDAA